MSSPIYAKQAAKVLNGMDALTQQRIRQGIEKIPDGDIKPLQGYTDGRKRLRIGKYRIVFNIDDEIIRIMEIGSRGDIYK
jgi:mRNA interferase RelE/StbE